MARQQCFDASQKNEKTKPHKNAQAENLIKCKKPLDILQFHEKE